VRSWASARPLKYRYCEAGLSRVLRRGGGELLSGILLPIVIWRIVLLILEYCHDVSCRVLYCFELRVLKFAFRFLYRIATVLSLNWRLASYRLVWRIASHHFWNTRFWVVELLLLERCTEGHSVDRFRINGFAQHRSQRDCRCGQCLCESRNRWNSINVVRKRNTVWSVIKERIFCEKHYWRILRISISVEGVTSNFWAHIRSHASNFLGYHITLYVYLYFFFFFFLLNIFIFLLNIFIFIFYYYLYISSLYLYLCYFTVFCVGHCFHLFSLRSLPLI